MQRPQALSPTEVIGLLRSKVARNPGDLDAVLMLGSALYKAGDPKGSAAALNAALDHHPGQHKLLMLLARAEAKSGSLRAALAVLARAQRCKPEDPQGWQVAAALAAELRDWPELQRIARGWTQSQADSVEAWQALSRAYFEESQFSEASAAIARVLQLEPDKPAPLISAARIATAAQRYEQAREWLDQARTLAPDSGELLFAYCRLYHLTGELEPAEEYCRRAIAARPGYVPAYVELGILREGRLAEPELLMVRRLFEDSGVHPEHRCMLGFTLGDALDERGDHAAAFAAWEQANALNRQISEQEGFVYHPEEFAAELELLPTLYAELSATENQDSKPAPTEPRPIFVLGMPRSGTTLVESILASHSRVLGGGELPTLYDLHEELLALARSRGPEAARKQLLDQTERYRERYLAALPSLDGADSIVDKQPLNFRSIGLIRLLFPDSPIFYLRREPLEVGLSIYRHKFAKNWPCASRLTDIGHYYGVHERIMEYWRACYGDLIYVVDYADLVANPEAEIPRLLEHAQLNVEPACLTPHKTRRPVATFSSVQVQRPMSQFGSQRTTHYEDRLGPLRDALARSGCSQPGR